MGGIGIWQLVIVLLIVFLLFGSKRLKTLGGDLGETCLLYTSPSPRDS